MSGSLNVIEAVTSACPVAEYRRLRRSDGLWWDSGLSLWIAMGGEIVREVLVHPDLSVRPPGQDVPEPLVGSEAGDIFAAFARMSDGPVHLQRKAVVSEVLDRVGADRVARATHKVLVSLDRPPTLHELQFHIPVMAMGEVLGVAPGHWDNLVAWTSAFVRAAAPGASDADVTKGREAAICLKHVLADDAVFEEIDNARLSHAERVANAIGFLFQTHDATAGLVGTMLLALARNADRPVEDVLRDVVRHDPPVHTTRRYATRDMRLGKDQLRRGDTVLAILASVDHSESGDAIAFGHGRHRCPGAHIALAIAKEIGMRVGQTGALPAGIEDVTTMHPSGNVRIPDLRPVRKTEAET